MRSKVRLATRMSLRLARLHRTAISAQRSRRLRSTRAAAPVLLAHAEVTKHFSMGPKLRYLTVIASNLQNMAVDMDSGSILRHGTFKDVEASLDTLQAAGSTSLYVVGALERDNGWGDGDEAIAASDTKAVVTAAADGNESDERFVLVVMYVLCVFTRKPLLC